MSDISELPGKNEELKQSGYYLKNGALYSRDPDQIFAKLSKIRAEGGTLDISFQGDLIQELDKCINNPDTQAGLKGIKNVISFGLAELYESIKRSDKLEDAEKFKQGVKKMTEIVETLLNNYSKDFFLLFTQEHDSSTVVHSLNVMTLAVYTYKHVQEKFPNDEFLKIGTLEEFALGGLLHDMGKVYMEDIILKTEKLTEEDWERIRKHPEDGFNILVKAGVKSNKVLNIVLFHHTRMDGSGYPKLKEGDVVLPITRLMSILDSLEAMISKSRRHNANQEKPRPSMREAIDKLTQESLQNNSLPIDFLNLVANALLAQDYMN